MSRISIEQSVIDTVRTALLAGVSELRAVIDDDMGPQWEDQPRPSAWLVQGPLDPGEPENFINHLIVTMPITVQILYDYHERDDRRGLSPLGRLYLAEVQNTMVGVQDASAVFAVREGTSFFGATTREGVGGLSSSWDLEFTRPRADAFVPGQ